MSSMRHVPDETVMHIGRVMQALRVIRLASGECVDEYSQLLRHRLQYSILLNLLNDEPRTVHNYQEAINEIIRE